MHPNRNITQDSHNNIIAPLLHTPSTLSSLQNYHNKDAVILPGRQPRVPPTTSGSDTEPQTIYANVDPDRNSVASSGGSSGGSKSKNGSYESVRGYLTDGGGVEGEGDSTLYYNLPEGANIDIGSLEEDNMYVYMKSGKNILEDASTVDSKDRKDRKRLESEPVVLGKAKYMNFTREQELLAKLEGKSADETRKEISKDSAQIWDKENGVESIDQSEEMPLYANYDETELEEEELYTEVTWSGAKSCDWQRGSLWSLSVFMFSIVNWYSTAQHNKNWLHDIVYVL